MMSFRALASVPLAFLPALLSSCVLAAGAGVGYVVYEKVLDNSVHEAQVKDDVDKVWTSAQETMSFVIDPKTELKVHEFPRRIEGRVDGADVVVEVESYDLDRTVIRVQAEKLLGHDDATAAEVMKRILDHLH